MESRTPFDHSAGCLNRSPGCALLCRGATSLWQRCDCYICAHYLWCHRHPHTWQARHYPPTCHHAWTWRSNPGAVANPNRWRHSDADAETDTDADAETDIDADSNPRYYTNPNC